MKQLISFTVTGFKLILLLLLGSGVSHGAESIKIVSSHFPPYVTFDEGTGEIGGSATRVGKEVCKITGVDCHFEVMAWARAFHTASTEPNTFVLAIARSPERESLFSWVATISPFNVYLFKRSHTNVAATEDWRSLRKYTVVGEIQSVQMQFLDKSGFDLIEVPTPEIALDMLFAGRVDLMVHDYLTSVYLLGKSDHKREELEVVAEIPELSEPLYFAANRRTDPELIARFQSGFKTIKESGRYDEIWEEARQQRRNFSN